MDEPLPALPMDAGRVRDYWLAPDARGGRPPVIAAEIAGTEETAEAVRAGLRVCLAASGNADLFRQPGIEVPPAEGVSPRVLVLAWRRGDQRPVLRASIDATRASVAASPGPGP